MLLSTSKDALSSKLLKDQPYLFGLPFLEILEKGKLLKMIRDFANKIAKEVLHKQV